MKFPSNLHLQNSPHMLPAKAWTTCLSRYSLNQSLILHILSIDRSRATLSQSSSTSYPSGPQTRIYSQHHRHRNTDIYLLSAWKVTLKSARMNIGTSATARAWQTRVAWMLCASELTGAYKRSVWERAAWKSSFLKQPRPCIQLQMFAEILIAWYLGESGALFGWRALPIFLTALFSKFRAF